MVTLIKVFVLDKDAQDHLATTAGNKRVVYTRKVTGNKREEIARFFKWVFPFHPMTLACAALYLALGHFVAIGQKHRIARLFSANRCYETRHHIGTVEIISDTAKPLSFALRTKHPFRLVEP